MLIMDGISDVCSSDLRPSAHSVRELSGRQLGRIELLDVKGSGVAQSLQVEAHAPRALEQQANLLVEEEHRGLLAAPDRRGEELQDEGALAGPSRPQDQCARPLLQPAAEKRVELEIGRAHV